MALLPNFSQVVYNGFRFPVETETTGFKADPQYDGADRSVIYVRYTITIRSLIRPSHFTFENPYDPDVLDRTIDGDMEILRKRLNIPGGHFVYNDKGFGEFELNQPGRDFVDDDDENSLRRFSQDPQDVAWGPKPRSWTWKPIGNDRAAWLEFTIEICVPECRFSEDDDYEDADFDALETAIRKGVYAGKLLAFNFSINIDIDKSGYTVRTYSGYIEIPMTRITVTDRTLPDIADAYYQRVLPPLPENFRRTKRNRVLSQDKRRLDFNITDEEIPVIPQENVVECDATHVIKCNPMEMVQWYGTISATYEITKQLPRIAAARRFWELCTSRTDRANLLQVMPVWNDEPNAAKRAALKAKYSGIGCLPLAYSFEENIFDKKDRFTFTYSFVNSLEDIVISSALWTPIPSSTVPNAPVTHQLWAVSLSTTAFADRGNIKLEVDSTEDAILSVCDTEEESLPETETHELNQLPATTGFLSFFPPPTQASSWVDYKTTIGVEFETGKILQNPLPTTVAPSELHTFPLPSPDNTTESPELTTYFEIPIAAKMNQMMDSASISSATIQNVQQQSGGVAVVTLSGYAIRAGYKIPVPTLWKFAGKDVTPLGGKFEQQILGRSNVPIFGAVWALQFAVPQLGTTQFQIPPNPALQTPEY